MAGIAAKLKPGVVIGRDFRTLGLTVLTEGGSRLVSLAFYVAAGRLLLPADFGVLRYTTALGGILFFFVQILGRALTRELGATDRDEDAFRRTATAGLWLSLPLLVITLALAVGLVLGEVTPTADLLGLIAMLLGRAGFEVYYAVARGNHMVGRMAATYLGGSVVQLVVLLTYAAVDDVDATEALAIFGLSSFVPILVCELRRPILVGRLRRPFGAARSKIVTTAKPLMLSHLFFLMWFNMDQILVERSLGALEVGFYGAAKTLAQLFTVLPFGINAGLVPRIAQLRTRGDSARAERLLRGTLVGSMLLTAAAAAVVAALAEPLVELLFGDEFAPAAEPLRVLGFGMVGYMGIAVISAVAVGWGRRALFTVTIAIAGCLQIALFLLVDYDSAGDAALFNAVSAGVACTVAVAWILIAPLSRSQDRHSDGPAGT